MPLDPTYWLTQKLQELERRLNAIQMIGVLANASSDGTTGWMKISAQAVSGRPAIEFHYTGGGGDLLGQVYQTTAGAIQITGGLQVSGTKNFVMSHPVHPGWLLRHASTESPVNGVEYWGQAGLDETGTAIVKLPSYFEALTKSENRVVMLTAIGPPAALSYECICEGAFTVHGTPGAQFAWLVKAERASQEGDWPIDFEAESPGDVVPPPATGSVRVPVPSSPMVDSPLPTIPLPAPEPEPIPVSPEPPVEPSPEEPPIDPPSSDLAPVETTP